MYASLGFTVDDVANFLQVSPRTVQLWVSGRVRIPYAAYKLLRLQLRYELPGDAWSGWHLSAGRLYTPEGFELNPRDFSWWGLLVRRAALFSTLYAKTATVAGRTATAAMDTRPGACHRPPAKYGPSDGVGRPAQPAGLDLSIGHIWLTETLPGTKVLQERAQNHESSTAAGQPGQVPVVRRERRAADGGGTGTVGRGPRHGEIRGRTRAGGTGQERLTGPHRPLCGGSSGIGDSGPAPCPDAPAAAFSGAAGGEGSQSVARSHEWRWGHAGGQPTYRLRSSKGVA